MSTLIYPQLDSGALAQFPVRKVVRSRTVINAAADGCAIKLADPAGATTEWTLTYSNLSDSEADALRAFFVSAEGSLNGFTFLDPADNLLAATEQLDDNVWQKDPALTVHDGPPWVLANGGIAGQTFAQTVAAPGAYRYCFSVYVRSAAPTTVRLWAGAETRSYNVDDEWRRVCLSAASDPDAESVRFGLEVAPFSSVEVLGFQAEAQPGASGYKASVRGGVYEDAHLRDDSLEIIRTDVNRNSCTVSIVHANHL